MTTQVGRRQSRRTALFLLYQWDLTGQPLASLYEGTPDAAGGPSNPNGVLNSRVGQAAGIGSAQRRLPNNVYRVDERGRVTLAIAADALPGAPNGLAFSPDYTKLYVVTGGNLWACNVGTGGRVSGLAQFAELVVDDCERRDRERSAEAQARGTGAWCAGDAAGGPGASRRAA